MVIQIVRQKYTKCFKIVELLTLLQPEMVKQKLTQIITEIEISLTTKGLTLDL
jgi:hypothetical protein